MLKPELSPSALKEMDGWCASFLCDNDSAAAYPGGLCETKRDFVPKVKTRKLVNFKRQQLLPPRTWPALRSRSPVHTAAGGPRVPRRGKRRTEGLEQH